MANDQAREMLVLFYRKMTERLDELDQIYNEAYARSVRKQDWDMAKIYQGRISANTRIRHAMEKVAWEIIDDSSDEKAEG